MESSSKEGFSSGVILVGETGLEPATSASQKQRSSHLNYSPIPLDEILP